MKSTVEKRRMSSLTFTGCLTIQEMLEEDSEFQCFFSPRKLVNYVPEKSKEEGVF